MSARTARILSLSAGVLLFTGFLLGSAVARGKLLATLHAVWQLIVGSTAFIAGIVILLFALSGTALALRSFLTSRGRRLRQFLSAQPLGIAEAPDGTYTKIVGRVRLAHDQVLTSAFGHTRCALFLTELWDESTSPPRRVRRILKAADHFRLDDGTSSIRVPSASLAPLFTIVKKYPAPLDEPLLSDALKLVFSEKTRPPTWATDLSVREFVLAEDQQIAVAGIVRILPSAEPHSTDGTYRTSPTMKILEPPVWSKLIACDAVSPRLKDIAFHV